MTLIGYSRGLPPADAYQDEDALVIRVELPGYAPEDLGVEAREHTLRVRGGPPAPKEGAAPRPHGVREFTRSFRLPADVEPQAAEAALEHGVLTVRIPRTPESRPRTIEVRAA